MFALNTPYRTLAAPGHRPTDGGGTFSATLRPTVPASSYVIGRFRANGFDGQIFLRLIQRLGRKAESPGYTPFNSKEIGAAYSLPSDHVNKMTWRSLETRDSCLKMNPVRFSE